MNKYRLYIKESQEYGSKVAHETEVSAKTWADAKRMGTKWKRENGYTGKVEVESQRGAWRYKPENMRILYGKGGGNG